MKTIITLITFSTTLLCLAAFAQAQPRAAQGGLAERFKQLDRNGDGMVSREEAGSLPSFDAVDKNKDGFLTLEEVQAYFATRRAARPAAPEQPAALMGTGELAAVDVVFELCVRDVEACAKFYRDGIGMREVEPGVSALGAGLPTPPTKRPVGLQDQGDLRSAVSAGSGDPRRAPEALLEWAGSYLRLRKVPGEKPAPATGNPMKQMLSQNGFRWFSLWFNNPAAISERLVKAGYPAPIKGGNVSMTRDPDGNSVEIMGVPRTASGETFTWGMAVSDEAAARKFYGAVLGLQEFDPWNLPPPFSMKMHLFATGAGRVKFSAPQGQRPREADAGPDAPGLRSLTLRVADLAAVREGLTKRDAKVEGEKRLLVTDPDGNRIYIEQAPADAIKAAAARPKPASPGTPSRQSLQDRIRAQYGNIEPKPHKEEILSQRPGEPPLKRMPDCDATRDAAGHDTLFKSICVPGVTDIQEGMNGVAIVDLNKDGLLDIVATYSAPGAWRKWGEGDKLRVFINDGGFKFHQHTVKLLDSKVSPESFARGQVPVLTDFNGDGFLDLFVTRHAQMQGGQSNPRDEKLGNGLYISEGDWDVFRDVSAKMGIRNEQAYNRQPSFGDVNKDGWLDIAVGCDNIKNAQGGFPHSRLYMFKPGAVSPSPARAVSRSPDRDTGTTAGLPHARPGDLAVGDSAGSGDPRRAFEDGHFEDIGGTDLVPDFGGFYHDSTKDRSGPDITLRDLDNDGNLDLIQSYHVDVLDYSAPYSPIEYRQGVFCWKNLLAKTAVGNGTGSDQDDRCLSQFPAAVRFEKITGNGLACEAHLKLAADKQSTEPVGKAPGLPYISLADVDNDGLPDVLAIGPASPGWAPRTEYVSGRFWRNKGGFKFEEATDAAGLSALNWVYRDWFKFFDAPLPAARTGARIAPGDGRPYFAAIIFGDFDNDGWVDLMVQDRSERPGEPARAILFMNRGDGTFEVKPTTFSGLDSHGICGLAADLNNDGLLDLLLAADPDNSGVVLSMDRYESKVYWNTGAQGARSNHWLRLRFSGVKDAELIGARVELLECGDLSPLSLSPNSASKSASTDPLGGSSPREIQSGDKSPHSKKQYRWIHPDHFYKSGCALEAHFGLGKQAAADLKVTLPSGKIFSFAGVRADQFLDLNLPTSQSTPVTAETKP